jgi:hypothetical protein
MLRHACGFALANAGEDTRSLQAPLTLASPFIATIDPRLAGGFHQNVTQTSRNPR